MPRPLFTFDTPTEPPWSVVNDGVMGGRSAGFVTVANGVLRFTGTLVTRGGGFTLTRAACRADLTGAEGIELQVRGSGRQFELEVDDGTTGYGRRVSRRGPFQATGAWRVVRVPFASLRSTIFGRAVSAPPINLARIEGIGIYLVDGRDGPFVLEVEEIRTYGDGASATRGG